MTDHAPNVDEVHAIAEAIADVLAERGLVVYAGPSTSARVLSAREVSKLLGRSAPWVYAHATELGAIRMGNGPKARIGFDLAGIEQWKRDNQIRPPQQRKPPRPATQHALAGDEPDRLRALDVSGVASSVSR